MSWLLWLPIILFLLSNFKALPLVWHLRLFTFLFQSRHWRSIPDAVAAKQQAKVTDLPIRQPLLLCPQIMHTRSPLLEIDFYMHKSNASFFTDVDIARSHLVASLIGMHTIRHPPSSALLPLPDGAVEKQGSNAQSGAGEAKKGGGGGGGGKKMLAIVLAGIEGVFRREIKPYQKYEVWTRVVGWDEKSLWFASWFVRAGAVARAGRDAALHGESGDGKRKRIVIGREEAEKAVLAVVISRNVVKLGRDRVRPQTLWEARGLVGPEVREAVENQRLRGVKAVKEGDQAELMEIWIDMVALQERVEVLADYGDIWAGAWSWF